MGPIGGAVARFRAAVASSCFPIRGVSIPAFVGARACAAAVTPWGCRPLSSPAQSIEDQLEARFTRNLEKLCPSHADSNTDRKRRLFQNWETYEASLPVRQHSRTKEMLKLYKLPYWGSDEDIVTMVTQLERESGARGYVKYVCAPGASGKTTSIVPAFLESKRFTHYLYLAFHNNGRRSFKLREYEPSQNLLVAEKQGAAFAVECARILLEDPDRKGPHEVPRHDDPLSIEDAQEALSKLVETNLGEGSKVLIHVDEHRKMCSRSTGAGAAFSRGAMQCLASVGDSAVVATYTEPPPLAPVTDRSSAVCRFPVVKPSTDIDKVMEYLSHSSYLHPCPKTHAVLRSGKFSFPALPPKAPRWRTWLLATLRLRFAMVLDTATGLGGIHRPGTRTDVDKFITAVADTVPKLHTDVPKTSLDKAINAIPVELPAVATRPHDHAADLLLGMDDSTLHKKTDGDSDTRGRGLNNLIVLPNGKISTPIANLVSISDPEVPVFRMGGKRFRALLGSKDLLISAPLEEAYLWTLACHLAISGSLEFGPSPLFHAKCTDIQPGRIFATTDPTVWKDLDKTVLPGVMYYADEPGREEDGCKYTHPLADMWFRADGNHVVLIDITGSGALAKTKRENFRATVVAMQKGQDAKREKGKTAVTVHGVILAPAACNQKGPTSTSTKVRVDGHTDTGPLSTITIVCGRDARELLGGLDQIFRYMTPA